MSEPAVPRPRHVFVVDDEAAAREMVGDYLAMQGFAVTLLDGGASLRAALAAGTPDLILLDLNMPEEDGLSIIRFIKQASVVPVILLTATASPIDRVVGLEMGADDYLTKPCELRELLARIRAVLRRVPAGPARAEERRLAVIASFDQVGFSRALQEDEAGTLQALDRLFADVVDPLLVRHRGTLFKTLGDGGLAEFASALDALEWGVAVQQAVHDRPAMNRRGGLRFRLGLAVGDVVLAGSDRLGEAVALAVRVQEVGRPGAVTASEFVYRLAASRVGLPFTDRGLVRLKNIALPMQVWEWSPE